MRSRTGSATASSIPMPGTVRGPWGHEGRCTGPSQAAVARVEAAGTTAVLVCAPALRPAIRRLVAGQTGGIPVLSYQEVTSADVDIETVGVVRVAEIAAA